MAVPYDKLDDQITIDEKKDMYTEAKKVQDYVKAVLKDDKAMEELKFQNPITDKPDSARSRLQAVVDKAELGIKIAADGDDAYHRSLCIAKAGGYKIVLKRDIDELMVNNYNHEWIKNWNGNLDISFCLDFFAIITYISDYYSKVNKFVYFVYNGSWHWI